MYKFSIYLHQLDMFERINVLKTTGYYPDTILDIGAHKGCWTREMKQIYPNTVYHLFEATDYPELNEFPNKYIAILNEKQEMVDWYENRSSGDSFFTPLKI